MRDSVRRTLFASLHPGFALIVALLCLLSLKVSAATIAFAGFETSGDTWPGVSISGVGAINNDPGVGQYPASQRIRTGSGSYLSTAGAATLTFGNVDVSAFDSITLTIHLSSTATGPGNGADDGDFVDFYVALNGAAFSNKDIHLHGFDNILWGYDDPNDAGGTAVAGTQNTVELKGDDDHHYSTITITIPNSALSVGFQIKTLNSTAEFWNIDDVTLTGTAVPEPSSTVGLIGGIGVLFGMRRLRLPAAGGGPRRD